MVSKKAIIRFSNAVDLDLVQLDLDDWTWKYRTETSSNPYKEILFDSDKFPGSSRTLSVTNKSYNEIEVNGSDYGDRFSFYQSKQDTSGVNLGKSLKSSFNGGKGDDYIFIHGISPFSDLDVYTISGGSGIDVLHVRTDEKHGIPKFKVDKSKQTISFDVYPYTDRNSVTVSKDLEILKIDVGLNKSHSYFTSDLLKGVDSPYSAIEIGTEFYDYMSGTEGKDYLFGRGGDDYYVINNASDVVVEEVNQGYDSIQVENIDNFSIPKNIERIFMGGNPDVKSKVFNATGNELGNEIWGNKNSNKLTGGDGFDFLYGDEGDDQLTGINLNDKSLGKGSIDKLRGDSGADLFILGNKSGCFYRDQTTTNSGINDYAWIDDFQKGDKIQLKGKSSDYYIQTITTPQRSSTGYGLYLNDGTGQGSISNGWDSRDELIGFIDVNGDFSLNNASLATNQGFFTYV